MGACARWTLDSRRGCYVAVIVGGNKGCTDLSFAHHVSPLHPVVPSELFLQEHFPVLLDEPLLLAAVCLAAARFYDLGASFNAAEPSRSKVVQGKLVTWILARLGYLAMGE